MRKSTNKLTKHELNFAKDTSYPLAKHQVIRKIQDQFQYLGQQMGQQFTEHELISSAEYKITRGENYKQMPYLVLDFPKISGSGFPIACRTMFWWGHYFSCNILIQSNRIDLEQTAHLLAGMKKVKLWIGTDLWEQDLQSTAYTPLRKLNSASVYAAISIHPYVKLSVKIGLTHFAQLPDLALSHYAMMLSGLSIKKGA
jgi:hypothetical protein